MKKLFLILFLIFMPLTVNAATTELDYDSDFMNNNYCDNSDGYGCIYCYYDFKSTGCNLKFGVLYKDDGVTQLHYYHASRNTLSSSSSLYYYCDYKLNEFTSNAFKENGELVCPSLSYEQSTPYYDSEIGKNKADIKVVVDEENGEERTDEIKKEGDKTPDENEKRYCSYKSNNECGDFTVSLNSSGKLDISMTSFNAKVGANSLDVNKYENGFKNGTCPDVYVFYGAGNMCTFSNLPQSGYDKAETLNMIDQNTGNIVTGTEDPYHKHEVPNLTEKGCSSLLGKVEDKDSPAYYISLAFSVIRYVAIILLLALTVMDFVSATVSQDNDALKKAGSKAIKRMIYCVIIFVLPIIIDLVLELINDTQISDCIDTNL